MSKTVLITATDTGVGKTIVSASLASILRSQGKSVGYFKPIETGCDPLCPDALLLSKITGQHYDEVVLYRFKEAVAPYVAEREEGKHIKLDLIFDRIKHLQEMYEYLIIEGAGGVAVPITYHNDKIYTYLDLISDLNVNAVVVSRASLGTINHTYLTVESMKSRNIKIKGIILNGRSESPSLAEQTNPKIIEKMTGIPVITVCEKGKIPLLICIERLKAKINEIFE
ncbi:dethiobiotin synthase [Persephonella sp.]